MADVKIIDLPALTIQSGTDLKETSTNGTGSFKETRAQQLTYFNANVQLPSSAKVTGLDAQLTAKLSVAGGTMTGFLALNADPSTNLQAATKQYVDNSFSAANLNTAYAATSGQDFNITSGLNLLGGSLNIGTSSSDSSAIFQIESSTQGFLPPAGTQTQRNAISSPSPGLQFFNKSSNTNDFYDGTQWQQNLTLDHVIQGANMSITPNSNGTLTFASTGGGGTGTQVQGTFTTSSSSTTSVTTSDSPINVASPLYFNSLNSIGTNVNTRTVSGVTTATIESTSSGARWGIARFDLTLSFSTSGTNTFAFTVYTNTGATTFFKNVTLTYSAGLNVPFEFCAPLVLLNTNDYMYLTVSCASGTAGFSVRTYQASWVDTTVASIPGTGSLAQTGNNFYLSQDGGTTYQNISGVLTPGNLVEAHTSGGQLIDAGIAVSNVVQNDGSTYGINISGNANSANSAGSAANINSAATSANTNFYFLIATNSSGIQPVYIAAPAFLNPSTGLASFTGLNLSGLSGSQAVATDGGSNLVSLAYTASNTNSTLVQRNASGNFSAGTITAALNGNASTATNGVVTTGSYADPSWITSLAGSKITGLSCYNAFTTVSTSSATLVAGTLAWITYTGGQCTLTLPNAAPDNTVCGVQGVTGASIAGWKINAQGSDKIQMGSSVGGTAGSITSTVMSATDGVTLIYKSSATAWVVLGTGLNMTVA